MDAFRQHRGRVVPLDRRDIDTDQIIPKQFLKRLGKTGFEDCLFYDWRHRADGQPDPDFVLNQAHYAGGSILLAGANFGCGSSREHAVWALKDFGFRAVLAPSFADIFAGNAVQNGLLTAVIEESLLTDLVQHAAAGHGTYALTIDLESRRLRDDAGVDAAFRIDDRSRHRLLEGLDDIGEILRHEAAIARFEAARG